ncbi:MAG: hypothetical protein C6Y20_10140 [Tagaea sp. CACIAM 22H2]|nr:hypothetical protein [Tagaea sp. CACIAM 22H2]
MIGAGLPIALACAESISVAMIFPILAFVEKGAAVFSSNPDSAIAVISALLERFGLPVALWSLMIPALLAVTIRSGAEYFLKVFSAHLTARHLIRLRKETISDFLSAGMAFHFNTSIAAMENAFHNETRRVARIPALTVDLLSKLLMLGGYFLLMMILSWRLALVFMALSAVGVTVFAILLRSSKRLGQALTEIQIRMTTLHAQAIQNIRLLKIASADSRVEAELNREVVGEQDNNIKVASQSALMRFVGAPLSIAIVTAVAYIAIEVLGLDMAALGLFAVLGIRAAGLATDFGSGALVLRHTIGGIAELERIVADARNAQPPVDGTREFGGLATEVRFEKVDFVYRTAGGDVVSLDDLNFVIPARRLTALVGQSGSGKTTTVDLLARLCDPGSGRITVDGVDLREYSIASYRRRIAVVSQSEMLLDATVRDNICLGLETRPDDQAIWRYLERAYAGDFVRGFPAGLDTRLGDRGCRMSGGQRQRLAFARALAREPEILILDEPTSALDAVSEAAIARTLRSLGGSVTVVVVAHRLSTIRFADQIVLLSDGSVRDIGTHGVLAGRQPDYRRLFEIEEAS